MTRHTGYLDSVTRLRSIYSDLDECEVKIGFDTYRAFYPFAELMELKGKEVSYVLRKDIINGLEALVITEITLLSVVQTVKSSEGVKLCPVNEARGVCNFDASSAQVGQFYSKSILMVTGFKHSTSKLTKWVDLTCLDKKSKSVSLRIFDSTVDAFEAENIYKEYIGRYIRSDIKYTNYGFQTDVQPELLSTETSISPSVALAKSIIESELSKYTDVAELNDKLQYIPKLEKLIAPEPGWALVRIATLLNVVNNIDNVVKGVDIDIIKKAAILSQLHQLPSKYKYTDEVKTVLFLRQHGILGADERLLNLMMGTPPTDETEAVYKVMREAAEKIIDVRYFYGG